MPLHRRRSSVNAVIQISAPFPLRGEAFHRARVERKRQNSRNLVRKLRPELFLRCFRNKVYRPLERTAERRPSLSQIRVTAQKKKKKLRFSRCLRIQISALKFPRHCACRRDFMTLCIRVNDISSIRLSSLRSSLRVKLKYRET